MTRSNKIHEKKLAEITGRRFILRYDDDGEKREASGCFHRDDYFLIGVVRSGQYVLSVDFKDYQLSAIKSMVMDKIKSDDMIIPGRYQRLTVRFRQLMERHIRTMKSPIEYACLLSVSGVYLNEAVKVTTGQNVSTLIGQYVTILAKRELCYTRRSAQEIAYGLGYAG